MSHQPKDALIDKSVLARLHGTMCVKIAGFLQPPYEIFSWKGVKVVSLKWSESLKCLTWIWWILVCQLISISWNCVNFSFLYITFDIRLKLTAEIAFFMVLLFVTYIFPWICYPKKESCVEDSIHWQDVEYSTMRCWKQLFWLEFERCDCFSLDKDL